MDYEKLSGLILLTSIYVMSSLEKLFSPVKTYNGIVSKGLPFPLLATGFAIISQLLSIILLFGSEFNLFKTYNTQLRMVGKYLLILFTVLATYFYHNVFIDKTQEIQFMKNLGLIGGLLLID